MSKPRNRIANLLAVALILPFAAGLVHAADTYKTTPDKGTADRSTPEKAVPPPTIDSNEDGKADAWDRDANGKADAWDVNDDGKPDVFDDNGDGRPDDSSSKSDPAAPANPPPTDGERAEPRF